MRRHCRLFLLALALAETLSASAIAQQTDCFDYSGETATPDRKSSALWQRLGSRLSRSTQAMKALEGGYLVSGGTIKFETIKTATLGPDGAYQFSEVVCGQTPCKTVNQGKGAYRAVAETGGGIFFMVRFSDAKRTDVCVSDVAEFDTPEMMVMKSGEAWSKQ